jgi:hypothetical protein
VGVAWVVVCKYSGMNIVIENSAAVVRNSAPLETAIARKRSRSTGTIGSGARRSRTTRAPASRIARTISARIVAESQA